MQEVKVECRSEFSYAQKPIRFELEGSWQVIEKVLSQAKSPNGISFTVLTIAGAVFELYYLEDKDIWRVKTN